MKQTAYCLFDTPLGSCGIGWTEGAKPGGSPKVIALQLPEASLARTRARITSKADVGEERDPPPAVSRIIELIRKHLSGDVQDFGEVELDLSDAGAFDRKVYAAARRIPVGQTTSYGELAKKIRHPGAARAVGTALAKNPIALIIPCHRILAAGGKAGGFSAHGGLSTKAKMLAAEGAALSLWG